MVSTDAPSCEEWQTFDARDGGSGPWTPCGDDVQDDAQPMSLLSTVKPCPHLATGAFEGLEALGQASAELMVSLSVPATNPSLLRDRVDASLREIRAALAVLDRQLVDAPGAGSNVEVGALLAFVADLGVGVRHGMAVREIRVGGNELLLDLARFTQRAADVVPVAGS